MTADRPPPTAEIRGKARSPLRAWFAGFAFLLLAGVAGLAGCGERPLEASRSVVVDTIGGVVHLSNPAEVPLGRAEPFVRIGVTAAVLGEPRPDEFGRVTAVVAGADGAVYVADEQGPDIRVFAADGEHLRTIGRRGGGPGEFESLASIGWVGDTLVTQDARNGRVGLLQATGEWVGQIPWLAASGPVVRVYTASPGEAYFLGPLPEDKRGVHRFLGWIRLTGEGPVDTLVIPRLDDPPPVALRCDYPNGGVGFFSIPFAPRLLSTPGPGGSIARSWSAEYRVVLTAGDDTLRVIERGIEPMPVTHVEYETGIARFLEMRERYPGMRCEASSMERKEVKPAIADLWFDQEGRLVVERYTAEGTAFDLYDYEGRIRGSVQAPSRDERVPPYFRGDRLYVVQRDSMGVQTVCGYRLIAERG